MWTLKLQLVKSQRMVTLDFGHWTFFRKQKAFFGKQKVSLCKQKATNNNI